VISVYKSNNIHDSLRKETQLLQTQLNLALRITEKHLAILLLM